MTTTADKPDLIERQSPVIEPDMAADLVLANYDRWVAFTERVKEIDKAAKEAVTEWIKANGPLDAGEFSYELSHEKKTTCTDVPGAVSELLRQSQGDVESFCRDFLSSGAVKYGAAKQALDPEVYARLFKTEVVNKVDKKLKKLDKKFIR